MKKCFIIVLVVILSLPVIAQNENNADLLKQILDEITLLNNKIETITNAPSTNREQGGVQLISDNLSSVSIDCQDSIRVLREQKAKLEKDTATYARLLNNYKRQNEKMNAEIASVEFTNSRQYKDSIQKRCEVLSNRVDSLEEEKTKLMSDNQKLKKRLDTLDKTIEYLNSIYDNATVDNLYKNSSKQTLFSHQELFKELNLVCPPVLQQTIYCFRANEICSEPYNKRKIADILRNMPAGSAASSLLIKRLNNYEGIVAESAKMYEKIKEEVYKEEIANDGFAQIVAKRKVWELIHAFLNKYPNMAEEYPAVYGEFQKILSAITENANKYPSSNPFSNWTKK